MQTLKLRPSITTYQDFFAEEREYVVSKRTEKHNIELSQSKQVELFFIMCCLNSNPDAEVLTLENIITEYQKPMARLAKNFKFVHRLYATTQINKDAILGKLNNYIDSKLKDTLKK